jgi:hypothetical protein
MTYNQNAINVWNFQLEELQTALEMRPSAVVFSRLELKLQTALVTVYCCTEHSVLSVLQSSSATNRQLRKSRANSR